MDNSGASSSISFLSPGQVSNLAASRAISCHASPSEGREHPIQIEKSVHGVSEMIVGVLGGGQLGRMLCQAASEIGVKVVILDPMENCPASSIAHRHMVGAFDNSETVQEFAKRCDILTVEIEHVDTVTLEKLEKQGIDCEPKASTIKIIQDKYLQKVHFSKHDIPLPEFMQIDDLESAKRAGNLFGYPLMIKSKRLAYDGRGNAVARSEEELPLAVTGEIVALPEMIRGFISSVISFFLSIFHMNIVWIITKANSVVN